MVGSWDSEAGMAKPVPTLEKPRTAELAHRQDRHIRRGRPAPSIPGLRRETCMLERNLIATSARSYASPA